MPPLGLDIGGANLKAASADGLSCSLNFDLWRAPDQLAGRLSELLARFPFPDSLAVTMTGELADCFNTKAEGVDVILRAVESAAGATPILVWQTSGSFVSADDARLRPLAVAAANWHALATWAGRFTGDGAALLLDIGSTTTDVIPLWNRVPVSRGLTDATRLMAGELVYTGVRRTPLCAVSDHVAYRGVQCPVAAELFATTLDVYLTLGWIREDATDMNTANGRPATIDAARDRLARMVCCDREEFGPEDAAGMARQFADAQQRAVSRALDAVLSGLPGPCGTCLVSGSGSFLAERIIQEQPSMRRTQIESLATRFSFDIAEAACAYAVAVLASER